MQRRALLAFNDPVRANRLDGLLTGARFELKSCLTVNSAIRTLSSCSVDMVFCQERLPDGSYRDILQSLGQSAKTAVVVCAEFYDKKAYIEAMSLGAFDYITHPYQKNDVDWIIENATRKLTFPSVAADRQHPAAA